jgi:hypothetical protein
MALTKKVNDEIEKSAKQLKKECLDKRDALNYLDEMVHDINEDMNLFIEEDSSEYDELEEVCRKAIEGQYT